MLRNVVHPIPIEDKHGGAYKCRSVASIEEVVRRVVLSFQNNSQGDELSDNSSAAGSMMYRTGSIGVPAASTHTQPSTPSFVGVLAKPAPLSSALLNPNPPIGPPAHQVELSQRAATSPVITAAPTLLTGSSPAGNCEQKTSSAPFPAQRAPPTAASAAPLFVAQTTELPTLPLVHDFCSQCSVPELEKLRDHLNDLIVQRVGEAAAKAEAAPSTSLFPENSLHIPADEKNRTFSSGSASTKHATSPMNVDTAEGGAKIVDKGVSGGKLLRGKNSCEKEGDCLEIGREEEPVLVCLSDEENQQSSAAEITQEEESAAISSSVGAEGGAPEEVAADEVAAEAEQEGGAQ